MKYNLDRVRVTQIMCVVALHTPNCNAAQPMCMVSESWNMGFGEPSSERTAVDYVEMA